MNHWLTLLHRYLGIAVGTLMAMWCLSGMVMMYAGYPVLQERHRVKARPAPLGAADLSFVTDALGAGAAQRSPLLH